MLPRRYYTRIVSSRQEHYLGTRGKTGTASSRFSHRAASVRWASGRGSGRMLRSWVGGLGRHGGEIFAEFEPEPFSGQVLIGTGLVLHNGAQTFEMVAKGEMVSAEPKGVGESDSVRAGAAKGLRAKGALLSGGRNRARSFFQSWFCEGGGNNLSISSCLLFCSLSIFSYIFSMSLTQSGSKNGFGLNPMNIFNCVVWKFSDFRYVISN
jgi:hypothetical protein